MEAKKLFQTSNMCAVVSMCSLSDLDIDCSSGDWSGSFQICKCPDLSVETQLVSDSQPVWIWHTTCIKSVCLIKLPILTNLNKWKIWRTCVMVKLSTCPHAVFVLRRNYLSTSRQHQNTDFQAVDITFHSGERKKKYQYFLTSNWKFYSMEMSSQFSDV